MRRNWLTGALFAALAVSLAFGGSQYMAKKRAEVRLENQYQRAFQELTTHVNGIATLLAKAQAISSERQKDEIFSDITREVFSAQQNRGQLPLTNVHLERTDSFLSNLNAFTYRVAADNGDKQSISQKDWTTIRNFYRQARYVGTKLEKMNTTFLQSGLRWSSMDKYSLTMANRGNDTKAKSNEVIKSFFALEDGLKQYPDPEFDGSPLKYKQKIMGLTGPVVSPEKAKTIAMTLADPMIKDRNLVKVTSRTGGEVPTYTLEINTKDKIMLEISRKGGHPVWMLQSRLINTAKIPLERAITIGQQYLASRGYMSMVPVSSEVVQNSGLVYYAYQANKILYYPDLLGVQVALDSGRVIALDAINYITFHRYRPAQTPKLTAAEAQKKLNKNLNVISNRLAVIISDARKEVLTYEFRCSIGNDLYLVYINANTGEEEKIRRINKNGVEIK